MSKQDAAADRKAAGASEVFEDKVGLRHQGLKLLPGCLNMGDITVAIRVCDSVK